MLIHSSLPQLKRPQTGVVLVMALVAMGVIAVTSALAIRSVTLGDRVGSNLRSQQLAMYAAEVALRWCEADVLRGPAGTPGSTNRVPVFLNEASPTGAAGNTNENWRLLANWGNAALTTTIPIELLTIQTGNNSVQPYPAASLPQCMAQIVTTNDANSYGRNPGGKIRESVVFQITVRGFSPNYTARTANNSGAGGEVWLQSILKDYTNRPPQ